MQNNKEEHKYNKYEYDKEYIKTHYTQIKVVVSNEKQYKERLKLLSIGTNKSQNQLLIEAIEDLFLKYDKALNEQQTDK